jgi:phosphatidate cytidylyltransferase
MSNFWKRTITGLSMVFILLVALFFSGWVFAVIFLVITVFGLWEFYGLIRTDNCQPQKYYGTVSGAIIYIAFTYSQFTGDIYNDIFRHWIMLIPFLMIIPFVVLSFIFEIYRNKPNPLINISTTVIGVLYIAIPLSLLNAFSGSQNLKFLGLPEILVGYFALTWGYDTAAYLYGKQFGKHKFFERISPKKTWEGTIAGGIVTLLTAGGLALLFVDIPLFDWLVLAAIVLVFGTHGDLAESLIKRSLNIKDSGSILPGHGGILDRFDTILISAPFVFLYFFFRNAIFTV